MKHPKQALGLLVIMAAMASCTSPPESATQATATQQDPWLPVKLQRWFYSNADSTRRILAQEIDVAMSANDQARALANRCLLAEALIFHNRPEALAWNDSIGRSGSGKDQALYTAWAQYYLGRWYGKQRQWDLEDSMVQLVLRPPEERLGPDLYLRAKIMEVQLAGNRSQLHRCDSIAMALRPLVDANGSPRRLCELLLAQGGAHLNISDPEGAEEIYAAALKAAKQDGDPELQGQSLLGIANAQADQGNTDQCATTTLQAVEHFTQVGDQRNQVTCRKILGYCYWQRLGPGKVLEQWLPAMHIADSLNMRKESVIVQLYLAKFRIGLDSAESVEVGYSFTDRFKLAYGEINKADSIAREVGDPELLAHVSNTRAAVLNWDGRFEEAIAGLKRSSEAFQASGNQLFAAIALGNIGTNEIARKNWRSAIHWLTLILPEVEQGHYNQVRLSTYNRLSFAYRNLGDYKQALEYQTRWYDLKDSLEGLRVTEAIAQTELKHAFAQQQLADSLAHEQAIQLERTVALESVHRMRMRNIGLAGGGLLLLVGGSTAFYLDRKSRRERYAKQAALLEIKALRSQMDPHFIFNALNSISAFIQRQQPDKARDFVAQFGKLMRLVLENSRRAEVPLARELEVLRLYLGLEQARLDHAFDFSITVDPGIDPENVQVPPLVMQPFVENAVWHGMAEKQEKGTVEVDIREADGTLITTICDDGAGMPKEKPADNGRRSLGTVITKERLDQLAELKGRPAGFRYLEREVGTCVEVVIPV